jgi:hypothetical protein
MNVFREIASEFLFKSPISRGGQSGKVVIALTDRDRNIFRSSEFILRKHLYRTL